MSGYRSHSEDHRKIPGYHVAAMLDDERTRQVLRGTTLGKEIKHYYPRNPHNFEPDEPLYHPKLEVSFQTSITEETLYWNDVDDAVRELEETLFAYLEWAGLPVCADEETFFSDAYFNAESESERNVRTHECPLPEIHDEQEAAVMRLWGKMNDSDRDLIDSLVTDGGKPSRGELADRTGWSYRTVRRFVERCEDVVTASMDGVEIASKYQQDLLIHRVRTAEENFRNSVEDAVLTAADAATDRAGDKWQRVKRRYGISLREDGLRDTIDVRYAPSDRDDKINTITEIRNAVIERYGSLRRFALTMTNPDGQRWECPNLDAWTVPVPKVSSRSKREAWLREYLGCDPRDAEPEQRRAAISEYLATH
jgi:hypothetical protein